MKRKSLITSVLLARLLLVTADGFVAVASTTKTARARERRTAAKLLESVAVLTVNLEN